MTQERHFAEELEQLKVRLLEMGGLAVARVGAALRGLTDRDRRALADVIAGDDAINRLHLEIDDRCFKLLALHQPMAVDLRSIVAALKINTDLERVGDLAVNIAEAATRYIDHAPATALVDLPRMAAIAQGMLSSALNAFVLGDAPAAAAVLNEDDRLDLLKNQMFRQLLTEMIADPGIIEPGIDLILISRHLERVGDHATNIAEDVIFIVQALDVRHHASG